jgi:hypothetical protein
MSSWEGKKGGGCGEWDREGEGRKTAKECWKKWEEEWEGW